MQDDFDGFSVNLFQDEDGDWLAHLVELPAISAFADTPAAALGELAKAWEAVRESYREQGEPLPVAPPPEGVQRPVQRADRQAPASAAGNGGGARGNKPERPGGGETCPGDRFIRRAARHDVRTG